MAAVVHVLQGEVGPVIRRQRIHFQRIVGPRAQAHQAGDDQVHVPRVEVVLAVIERVVSVPRTREGVRCLGDVGPALTPLGAAIRLEQAEVIGLGHVRLAVVAEQVGQGDQRLGGGEEVFRVHEEPPGGLVPGVREIELPGDKPNLLSAVGTAGVPPGLVRERFGVDATALVVRKLVQEELPARIPQLGLHPPFQRGSACGVALRRGGVSQEGRRPGDGQRVGVQVAVERGTVPLGAGLLVIGQPAVDVDLHAVVQAVPEEHAVRRIVVFRQPAGVLGFHVRQHGPDEPGVAQHQVGGPHRVAVPIAVAAGFCPGRLEPVASEVLDDPAVLEPAHLVELVP